NIDGAEANSDFFGEERGGTEAPFVFSQAAIREFQVIRSTYSAEYARGVGATINAVTKSGTNELEGELFFFRRDSDWGDERSPTVNGLPVTETAEARDSDQYGLALGGPIVRDRLFFFVNADFQDISEPLLAPDVRTTSRFTSLPADVQQAFLTRVEGLIGNSLDNEVRFDSRQDQETYLVKLDGNLATSHHASLRYNSSDYNNFPSEGSGDILSNNGDEFNKVESTVLQADSIFGSSVANQLIVQYGIEERPIFAFTDNLPETIVSEVNNFTFGRSEFLPNRTDETKWQIKDQLSYAVGRNQFKVGAEYLQTEIDNLFPREAGGQWMFNTVADFLANRPSRLDQGYGPTLGLNSFDYDSWGAFLQDTLSVGERLTLDFGVRYDFQSIPEPVGNVYPTRPEFLQSFNDDDDNFAPRFGFAYDVRGDGRSVLRGGVGQYYNYLPSILYAAPLAEIAGLYNRISVNCATATCPTYPAILTPEQFAVFARTASTVTTVSPDLEATESLRSSLGFEQQIGASFSVGLEAVYAQIDNAQRLINSNIAPAGFSYGNLPVYSQTSPSRPYPELQAVRQHRSDGEGEYTSLTVSARKRAIGALPLTLLAHYTWSEAIDQDSNERSTSSSFSLDPFNPSLSEGRADYDVTHRVVMSGTYELPWGVMLSGIFLWRSGTPYTAGIDTGFIGLNGIDSQSVDTPVFVDGSGNVIDLTLANGMSPQQLAAFLAGQGARMEDRNERDQPDFTNFDLRLSKSFDFNIIELELIGEVFNVFNTENEFITTTNQTMFTGTLSNNAWRFTRNPNFGRANAYNNLGVPRQYQAAVRVRF
ncbi:MAG TPA: TonB-dependent receptor, partial [Thermoanaerobaculia bacterium]|nr:TonB-dependent receptor [Thermoanaerobaculia bacterium]